MPLLYSSDRSEQRDRQYKTGQTKDTQAWANLRPRRRRWYVWETYLIMHANGALVAKNHVHGEIGCKERSSVVTLPSRSITPLTLSRFHDAREMTRKRRKNRRRSQIHSYTTQDP